MPASAADSTSTAEVRLVDLDVVKRYSLAVRRETAPAVEVLAALDASRDLVLATMRASGNGSTRRTSRRSKKASK